MSQIQLVFFLRLLLFFSQPYYHHNKYTELQQKAEDLKLDINKLNDPKYLADYARENYLYSKEGEYIIQIGEEITETTETIDAINLSINKNYILMGLAFLVVLIFMYILLKGKNNPRKKEL